jgi:predicted nucleotidyltransferase
LEQRLKQSRKKDATLHLSILDFDVPILTTNYDSIIEDVIHSSGLSYPDNPVSFHDEERAAELLSPTRPRQNFIFKVHGCAKQGKRLIIGEEDYTQFYFHGKWPVSLHLLRHLLATKMIVFVGFSLSDPELMPILREATRHSSVFQHLAFIRSTVVTTTEQDSLRRNYHVDSLTFDRYEDLPLLIMEMRNMMAKNRLSLTLGTFANELRVGCEALVEVDTPNAAVILFGSHAKYGSLAPKGSDVDLLVIEADTEEAQSEWETFQRVKADDPDNLLKRRVDIVRMSRDLFEEKLRCGDTFSSSILLTGCALKDPLKHFALLAKGFESCADLEAVRKSIANIRDSIWLRLCVYESIGDHIEYAQACDRWVHTVMQGFVVDSDYGIDTLLAVGLLGNARFTAHEFGKRFPSAEMSFFDEVRRGAKEVRCWDHPNPSVFGIARKLVEAVERKDISGFLQPTLQFRSQSPRSIHRHYHEMCSDLENIFKCVRDECGFYGPSTPHERKILSYLRDSSRWQETPSDLDVLFFFRLHANFGDERACTVDDVIQELEEWNNKAFNSYL